MPNWIEGTFRAKGRREKLEKFMNEALSLNDKPVSFERLSETDWYKVIGGWPKADLCGTNRQYLLFLGKDGMDLIRCRESDDLIFAVDFMGDREIDVDGIAALARKYGVRIRVNGFESSGMFTQTMECDEYGGHIRVEKVQYESVDRWVWYSPAPFCGG